MKLNGVLAVLSTIFCVVYSQTNLGNLGNTIASNIEDCYNVSALPGITSANQRPPANLNLFIEYLRKLEDANPTITTRELSLLILQHLRQDGIIRSEKPTDIRYAIPYSSNRVERYKFRSIIRNFLPKLELKLNFGDLNDYEKCSLHYMISNTIDDIKRENEGQDCTRSSRYTARIVGRKRRSAVINENEDGVGESNNNNNNNNKGEDLDNTEQIGSPLLRTTNTVNVSQCPLELGVVYSQFGTFKAGNFLAGIATGLSPEDYVKVDNRYAGTIIGELCEALLYQGTPNVSLGVSGGWNSTINPKYYFLQSNSYTQATDAELRGALDGLFIGMKMKSLISKFNDLKISQIVDMYYSPYEKGVLEPSLKACNRNVLYSEITNTETMRMQLVNYMPELNKHAISGSSVSASAFQEFSKQGIAVFESYLPSMTSSDLSCLNVASFERVKTDLLIFVDSSWSYNTVQPVLSYILNNIDVNKFQSSYTVFGGSSIRNLTRNSTKCLSDFYLQYNETVHAAETAGFDYIKIFEFIENYGSNKLNNNSYSGGESIIVLLVPKIALTEEQSTFLTQRLVIFNNRLPDIHFAVLGSGNANDYSIIVPNTARDVTILQETSSEDTLKALGEQVVKSIKEVGRAIINPSCTAQYSTSGGAASSTFFITDYVEPFGISYYRISPNYFHSGGDNRILRIKEQGYGTISACLSRDTNKPDNSTASNCYNLTQTEAAIDIKDYCNGNEVSSCQPIYLSVTGGNSLVKCSVSLCRFPYDIKYEISLENVGCAKGSASVGATLSIFLLVLCFGTILIN